MGSNPTEYLLIPLMRFGIFKLQSQERVSIGGWVIPHRHRTGTSV